MNNLLSLIGLLALCLTWALIGAAAMWCWVIYRPRLRRCKMARIAHQVQAELDAAPPPWWARYVED